MESNKEVKNKNWVEILPSVPLWLLTMVIAVFIGIAVYSIAFKQIINLGLLGQVGPAADFVPQGAIVAFKDKCPDGWSIFKPTISRFVMGAGDPKLASGTMGFDDGKRPLAPVTLLQYGGHIKHLLAPVEAPTIQLSTVPYSRNDHMNVISILTNAALNPAAQEFEIIPPFVALNYCEKGKG